MPRKPRTIWAHAARQPVSVSCREWVTFKMRATLLELLGYVIAGQHLATGGHRSRGRLRPVHEDRRARGPGAAEGRVKQKVMIGLTPDMDERYLRNFPEDCPHHYSY